LSLAPLHEKEFPQSIAFASSSSRSPTLSTIANYSRMKLPGEQFRRVLRAKPGRLLLKAPQIKDWPDFLKLSLDTVLGTRRQPDKNMLLLHNSPALAEIKIFSHAGLFRFCL
jgi:hypothetical protein